MPVTEVDEVGEAVAAARPDVQDAEATVPLNQRLEDPPRRCVPAEKPVCQP